MTDAIASAPALATSFPTSVLGQQLTTVARLIASREELEAFLGRKVHLFLHVKVQENWADDPDHYNAIGLPFNV